MRERSEYLTEREMYVLDNHPGLSYQKIGVQLGITAERVRQIKQQALRHVREEKRRELAIARGNELVHLTLKRNEVWLLMRGLRELGMKCLQYRGDMRSKDREPDPDEERIDRLYNELRQL